MNLILSDVEETVMLVDGMDGAPPGQGVVNVSPTSPSTAIFVPTYCNVPGGQKEDGNALCERRWCYSGKHIILYREVHLDTPYYSGITPVTYMTSVWLAISFDVVRFCPLFNLLRCEM